MNGLPYSIQPFLLKLLIFLNVGLVHCDTKQTLHKDDTFRKFWYGFSEGEANSQECNPFCSFANLELNISEKSIKVSF